MSFQGKKNIYFCKDCGHGVVTQDVDQGTTPFAISCVVDECAGMATSFFYRAPQEMLANITPAFEWYAPTAEQLASLDPASRDHVARGGLLKRPHVPAKTGVPQ